MTRFGVAVLLASIAVFSAIASMVIGFHSDGEKELLESPKVMLKAAPYAFFSKIAHEFEMAKAVWDVVQASSGRYTGKYIIVRSEESFKRALEEVIRISGRAEVHEYEEGKLLRLRDYGLVVVYER